MLCFQLLVQLISQENLRMSAKPKKKSSQPTASDQGSESKPQLSINSSQIEEALSEMPDRELQGSLEQCRTALREAYINFKDQSKKCVVDVSPEAKQEGRVFYFRPETFLLQDPEKEQKVFRENLLKRISTIPRPEEISMLGDELHRQQAQVLADQSMPKEAKRNLAFFFKRRAYTLQHKKYKLLTRWAHHALSCESLERMGGQATFLFGKLEFSIEQAMQRRDRLEQEDFFDEAISQVRPSTCVDLGEELGMGTLYVENKELRAQSLIREDDVEVYLRGITYRNKCSKVVNKFMSRLKWLALSQRFEIFEKAIRSNNAIKERNIKKQKIVRKKVMAAVTKRLETEPELEQEAKDLKKNFFITKYKGQHLKPVDKIKNSWRTNHEECPNLVGNTYELKLSITEMADVFKIKGDIEADHGYSFSHQITMYFPTYFQKQVIKSQFTLYDGFVGDADANERQKSALVNLTQVDTNIFRDISTTPDKVPTNENIQNDIKDEVPSIRIMRLKSCAFFIDYICLVPDKPDWLKKQMAVIGAQDRVDTLLKSAFNYLDVNDLASVNQINEDSAAEHRRALDRLNDVYNSHNQFQGKTVGTQEGEQTIFVNQMPNKGQYNDVYNMEQHLLKTVQGQSSSHHQALSASQQRKLKLTSTLRFVPQHLVVTFNTLRYMESRDAKTRLLYYLNYFRAVQKRFALDLREFGTRDRIDSHQQSPFIPSTEASKASKNADWKTFSKGDKSSAGQMGKSSSTMQYEDEEYMRNARKTTVFDADALEKMRNLTSVRMYKINGIFNNKVYSTCPFYPKFHCTFGEPTVRETSSQEFDNEKKNAGVSSGSIRFMGRIDHIEINEASEEVYVKDDFGIYVMYDCCLQDIKMLEDDLVKTGTYFISRQEVLQDSTTEKPFAHKDRLQVMHDLVVCEAQFQFRKVKLIQCYLECYEHVCDPLEQQRLMQVVTDLMARRPRLDIHAGYFRDSYTSEIECLDAQFDLLRQIVAMQVNVEKAENKRLQDSLNLSYQLANLYEQNKFKFNDRESELHQLMQKKKWHQTMKVNNIVDGMDKLHQEQMRQGSENDVHSQTSKTMSNHSKKKMLSSKSSAGDQTARDSQANGSRKVQEEDSGEDDGLLDFDLEQYFKPEENQFIKLLGLPEITIENLFMNNKEKDSHIGKIMNEHANFVQMYDGHPEFINFTSPTSDPGNNTPGTERIKSAFEVSPWSQSVGMLDFYENLDFSSKLNAIMAQGQQELYDVCKPYNSQIMTHLDTEFAKAALDEFRQVLKIQEGACEEYVGREYIEDEAILGSSEKMIFYTKELVSNLTAQPKFLLDPYVMAKLDIHTIKYFEFPDYDKTKHNKYQEHKYGVPGGQSIREEEEKAIMGMAKFTLGPQKQTLSQLLQSQRVNGQQERNVTVPSLLTIYCNIIELQRLRSELIVCASECAILQKVYLAQAKACKKNNLRTSTDESISFAPLIDTEEEETKINYLNDGPGAGVRIDLAVREFDPALLSNMNYKHPDSFKLSVMNQGIEEVRAALAYQIMQKHILIVSTRANQLMIDTHQKAITEVNLIQDFISVPNSFESVNDYFSRSNRDQISSSNSTKIKQKYVSNMSSMAGSVLYNVMARKNQQKTTISKQYADYQVQVSNKFPYNPYCVHRVMRTFKLKLLHRQVQSILTELYLDAQKVQALQAAARLRHFSRYFHFNPNKLEGGGGGKSKGKAADEGTNPQIFVNESNKLIENIPKAYQVDGDDDDDELEAKLGGGKDDIKSFNIYEYSVIEHNAVPSSHRLMEVDASPADDVKKMRGKMPDIIEEKKYTAMNNMVKQMQEKGDLPQRIKQVKEGIEQHGRLMQVDVFTEELKCDPELPEENEPEKHLKAILPHFTPIDLEEPLKSVSSKDKEKAKKRIARVARISGNVNGNRTLDYEEAMYFGDSKYAKLIAYYQNLERILQLEWFMNKLRFRRDQVVCIDHAVETGLPFWHETEFEEFTNKEVGSVDVQPGTNQISQKFLHSSIADLQTKRIFAAELMTVSSTVKNVIKTYKKTKPEMQPDFLPSYCDYRYMQIVGALHKLVEHFYRTHNLDAVQCLREALSNFTKTNHVKLNACGKNSYYINNSFSAPSNQNLNSTNILFGFYSNDESIDFGRCVQPVINEHAAEPPQVTLFQTLFQTDPVRKMVPSQFGGQLVSTQNAYSFSSLDTALLDMEEKSREHCQAYIVSMMYQANDYMETVNNESNLSDANDQVYSYYQLENAKKFISDVTTSLLLKQALICWTENCVAPESAEQFEKFQRSFRDKFFWKCVEEKEELKRTARAEIQNPPTEAQLKEIQGRIQQLSENQNLVNETEEDKRDKLVKVLKEEFSQMKRKVTFDNYFVTLAEKRVLANEIEKEMIRASVYALDAETSALQRCFTLSVPKIQMLIRPFQQFAATLFDQVDPHSHLDVVNKVEAVQELLTKLRNRGTEVDTLTSGTGIVFTVKDLNECLNDFCRKVVKFSEKQMKSRSDLLFSTSQHYQELLYVKDQKISEMDRRLKNQTKNLDNLINARMFEKGNQLIYELDSCNRLINLYKRNFYNLEDRVRSSILAEQANKFNRMMHMKNSKTVKFKDYRDHVCKQLEDQSSKTYKEKAAEIKDLKEKISNIDPNTTRYKAPQLFPKPMGGQPGPHGGTGNNVKAIAFQPSKEQIANAPNGMHSNGLPVPADFKHYSYCSCYTPNERHPRPTLELAEIEMDDEATARRDLYHMCEVVRKQRLYFKTKEVLVGQKFQNQINLLKKQLSNNSYMWEKMSQQENNEKVLKQELLYTQQSLSAAEKVIEKLHEEIKKIESDRQRLAKYKVSKADRLKELEDKIKNFEVYENVDTEKLVNVLTRQDNQLRDAREAADNAANRIFHVERKAGNEVNTLKGRVHAEQMKSQQVIEKMEQMKMELKLLETNDTSVAAIWKKKCVELFEVCNALKDENTKVRDCCNELIVQGVQAADMMQKDDILESVRDFEGSGQHNRYHSQADSQRRRSDQQRMDVQLPRLESDSKQRVSVTDKQRIQEMLYNQKRNILTADNTTQGRNPIGMHSQLVSVMNDGDYDGVTASQTSKFGSSGLADPMRSTQQPGDHNKFSRLSSMQTTGPQFKPNGSNQKANSLQKKQMNQMARQPGALQPPMTAGRQQVNSVFSQPITKRPQTKAPPRQMQGPQDLRSMLQVTSGTPNNQANQGSFVMSGIAMQTPNHANMSLQAQQVIKQKEFHQQFGLATASSKEAAAIAQAAKHRQVSPGVFIGTPTSAGGKGQDSLYESSKGMGSGFQVRVAHTQGPLQETPFGARGPPDANRFQKTAEPKPIQIGGGHVLQTEQTLASSKMRQGSNAGNYEQHPPTQDGSSQENRSNFVQKKKSERESHSTNHSNKLGFAEEARSPPSTREIQSREIYQREIQSRDKYIEQ